MTDLSTTRRDLIALRVKHAGNPKIVHRAPNLVGLTETLSHPIDPDHERRCRSMAGQQVEGLAVVIAAQQVTPPPP